MFYLIQRLHLQHIHGTFSSDAEIILTLEKQQIKK